MKKISAEIVADSVNEHGNRITTMLLTYPRFIHGEVLTHRMFSRNSASSRAIPFEKMIKMVEEDPFIPIAWQKDHKGMQGTEYFGGETCAEAWSLMDRAWAYAEYENKSAIDQLRKEWLDARDNAVQQAKHLSELGVTKQLCNRLLEPFMWHTVLLTGTEFDNFFELRCPQYSIGADKQLKSKKNAYQLYPNICETFTEIDWYKINHSQAEIHMQALAEAMWDAMNESTPRQLKAGEWHIPFIDRFDSYSNLNTDVSAIDLREDFDMNDIKIATARCARLSYMTFDGKIDYEKDIQLHDRLLSNEHMSPFEHCAKAMDNEDYYTFRNGHLSINNKGVLYDDGTDKNTFGWCNNFKGFIQYRYLIENK